MTPARIRIIEDGDGGHVAIIDGKRQRPSFNSRGAALAFATAVRDGKRAAEPINKGKQ